MGTLLNPKRTVAELKELRALTGDENGAQRVALHTLRGYAAATCGNKSVCPLQN